ncbi:MAG TPA: NfeD family protein [Mycobacteriales bacterium]
MTDDTADRQIRELMRQAFDGVEPTRDLAVAARQDGQRLRRRRAVTRLVGVGIGLAVLVTVALTALHRAGGRFGGDEVGGVAVWLLWLVAAGVLAVAEVLSLDLVLIMCAGGAAVAAGVAGIGAPPAVQMVAFAVSAVGLLGMVRPAARRRLELSVPDHRTGIGALVGQQAVVVRTVDARGGRVRLAGEEWSARAYDSTQVLVEGTTVSVMEIRGAEAVVWGDVR